MPCAAATRRATGVLGVSDVAGGVAVAVGAAAAAAGCPPLPPSAATVVGSFLGAAPSPAGASPGSSSASGWPTSTVSSSWARILTSLPACGAGTSASTLSVETSTIVSSLATQSPSCLCQVRIVPSDTDSPICGMGI